MKHPHMFRARQVILLNTVSLLPHVRFDAAYAREVNPAIEVLHVPAKTGDGMAPWYGWPRHERAHRPNLVSA